MSTARDAILTGFFTGLSEIAGLSAFRSRDAALLRNELPAVVVEPEEESVEFPARGISIRHLTVVITLLLRGEPPDQVGDPLIQQIHAIVMADPTQSGLVGRTVERGTKWTFETGDVTGLACEIRYDVTYATPAGDLSVRI